MAFALQDLLGFTVRKDGVVVATRKVLNFIGSRLTASDNPGQSRIDLTFSADLPYFDVQDYGAKGDGSTDDTTAISNALTAASAAGGGIVYFRRKSGTYRFTTLTVPADVVMEAAPGVILETTTTTGNAITLSGARSGCRRISVKTVGTATTGSHFRLTGARTFCEQCVSESGWIPFFTSTAADQRVENCTVVSALSHGILIGNTGAISDGALVRGNTIANTVGNNIHLLDSNDALVTGNQCRGVAATSVADGIVISSNASGAVVVGNVIDCVTLWGDDGISLNGAVNATVCDNLIRGWIGNAIEVSNTVAGAVVRGNKYVANGFNGISLPTLTIASGAITLLGDFDAVILVDTEASAATDDLDTINGLREGQTVTLQAADGARTVVVKDTTGNLRTAGDHSLDAAADTITLMARATLAYELSRADNAA